ncbi:hypothetical protein QU487_17555 [Crenobacter sp. SG2305]|uniref:hypothetical protein n=1 Tax=Crenobacter oryzisoli TaxID=3056844 RepID=UPI0025AB2E33|nr:hypothetical protein [Crenobacter sp. SG2305]MDN0084544.1 hypothetical protein [Crenobacter sp. SG2305]
MDVSDSGAGRISPAAVRGSVVEAQQRQAEPPAQRIHRIAGLALVAAGYLASLVQQPGQHAGGAVAADRDHRVEPVDQRAGFAVVLNRVVQGVETDCDQLQHAESRQELE